MVLLTVRIRWRFVPLLAVLAMAWSLLSAAPAHAAIEYLAVRDWSTFASWQAPSGNIYTGQYRQRGPRHLNWEHRLADQYPLPGEWAVGDLQAPVQWRARRIREQSQRVMGVSLGDDGRESGAVAGEVIWQGAWHSVGGQPYGWYFTWGGVKVTWTAPNVTSSIITLLE